VQHARDAGHSRDQSREALRLPQIAEAEFEAAINSDHPPTAPALAAGGKRPAPLVDLNRHFPDRPVSGSGYRPPDLVCKQVLPTGPGRAPPLTPASRFGTSPSGFRPDGRVPRTHPGRIPPPAAVRRPLAPLPSPPLRPPH